MSTELRLEDVEDEETLDLSPHKEVYRSAATDVNPISAIAELVDNALDNWQRRSRRTEPLNIDIIHDNDALIIRDDSGGLGVDDIKMLFALGVSAKRGGGTIGAYGIGAKKAIIRLGKKAELKSRARGAETGYGFVIDEQWLEDDSNWTVDKREYPELEQGVTEIRVENLNLNWEDLVGDADLEDEDEFSLEEKLSKTYELYLRKYGHNLSIKVNGAAVKAPARVDWSYTPFSGLHPRRYEGIELQHKDLSAPITMNVTVGLMRKGNPRKAGVDIYCQGRKVVEAVQDGRGGFKSTGKGGIGLFHPQHNNRLRVLVELETEGDSADLPWDSQKSDIDPHDVVTHMVTDWLKKIVTPYFRAKAGPLQKPAVEQFDADHNDSANRGKIEVLDYSTRDRVTDRPDTSFSDIKRIEKQAESDAEEGLDRTDELKSWQAPLYKENLKKARKRLKKEGRSTTKKKRRKGHTKPKPNSKEREKESESSEANKIVPVPFKLREYDRLLERLELSGEAGKEEVGEALATHVKAALL